MPRQGDPRGVLLVGLKSAAPEVANFGAEAFDGAEVKHGAGGRSAWIGRLSGERGERGGRDRERGGITLDAAQNFGRKGRITEPVREIEAGGEGAPALRAFGAAHKTIPIDRAAGGEARHIAGELGLPPTFPGGMDAEVEQVVFGAERAAGEAAQAKLDGTLDGRGRVEGQEIGGRKKPMQIHFAARKAMLQGDLAGAAEPDVPRAGLFVKTVRSQEIESGRQLGAGNEDIEVVESAQRKVPISGVGQDGPLEGDGGDTGGAHGVEDARQLPGHA